MPESFRLFNCKCCGGQVVICRRCDRGHIYCAGGCAAQRRSESIRRAAKSYQDKIPGRLNHARRQREYRRLSVGAMF